MLLFIYRHSRIWIESLPTVEVQPRSYLTEALRCRIWKHL